MLCGLTGALRGGPGSGAVWAPLSAAPKPSVCVGCCFLGLFLSHVFPEEAELFSRWLEGEREGGGRRGRDVAGRGKGAHRHRALGMRRRAGLLRPGHGSLAPPLCAARVAGAPREPRPHPPRPSRRRGPPPGGCDRRASTQPEPCTAIAIGVSTRGQFCPYGPERVSCDRRASTPARALHRRRPCMHAGPVMSLRAGACELPRGRQLVLVIWAECPAAAVSRAQKAGQWLGPLFGGRRQSAGVH